MVLMNANYTLLTVAAGSSAGVNTGTALSYAKTEKSNVSVVVTGNTAAQVVIIDGTTAATSTGSYVTIDSTSSASTSSYNVGITAPYTYIRARVTTVLSTATTVSATVITQGAGY